MCEEILAAKDDRLNELGNLLAYWRQRLNPRRIAGVDTGRRRLKPGLTQAEVAMLTGVSLSWYRALEKGKKADFSPEFLQRVALTLRLSEDERVLLFQLALGHAPAPRGLAEDGAVDEDMQKLLDQMLPHPAYISNVSWDIVAHNKPQEEWFPWVPYEPNLMRWAFLYPEAREQLVNWKEDWARPFLAQLRVALGRHPDNEALRRLKEDILRGNPVARELWAEPETIIHPDGHVRRLRLPAHHDEEVSVKIMAMAPLRNMDLRFIVLLRTDV
ncbi:MULTISPECIES: helix-turn-helix domain-containing protein [Streptomyces]|uniref:MmyB family transcriptional regulator n=1 Tax=Streptomyces TaxID=1883 RepID=UPI000F737E53|nr:helix-turn-helix domain-containing protein [Streptomyces sp. WAC00469]RSR99035.1 XRE family transcriptional regulator [Streptomyces sp. WAC00469]